MVVDNIIFDIVSLILSITATVYLFIISKKLEGDSRKATTLLAFGLLITITIHSVLSLISDLGYIEMPIVMRSMSIQILIGSLIIIWGTHVLYRAITENLSGK